MKKIVLNTDTTAKKTLPKAYRGKKSGRVYIQSSCGSWFSFSETGGITKCSPCTGNPEFFEPLEGPVTLTFHQD